MKTHYYKSIFDIKFNNYKNLKYIFFDIDNTLVAPNIKTAEEKIKKYIQKLKDDGYDIYLYSNNSLKRIDTFAKSLDVKYLSPAKKPFSRELVSFFKANNRKKEEAIFIGDQVFTDVLSGKFAGIQTILVEPYSNTNDTWFVGVKRLIEKPFRNIIKKNKEVILL